MMIMTLALENERGGKPQRIEQTVDRCEVCGNRYGV